MSDIVGPTNPTKVTRKGVPRPNAGVRRGVTFKAGLLSDKERLRHYGPLVSMQQVVDGEEDISSITFTKFIQSVHAEQRNLQAEKGYFHFIDGSITCFA